MVPGRDIARQLGLRDPETIVTGFDRLNLHYHVIPSATDRDKDTRGMAITLADAFGPNLTPGSTRQGSPGCR